VGAVVITIELGLVSTHQAASPAAVKLLPTAWPARTTVRLFASTDSAMRRCADHQKMPRERAQPTGSRG
jgi:hypothetical protein